MQTRTTEPALADPDAREFLRQADPVLARIIDARPDFRPRAWTKDVATLTSIPGIGPWTAHGFLLVALDRPDVFLTGDLALRRAVERTYRFDHLPTDDEMLQLAEHWRPYRSLAVSYLFASEFDEPAAGLGT